MTTVCGIHLEAQPRFVAYARAQGRTPEEQAEHDDGPGGFLTWIVGKKSEYHAARPGEVPLEGEQGWHDRFTRWLETEVDRGIVQQDV